jgi:hypothetical protein
MRPISTFDEALEWLNWAAAHRGDSSHFGVLGLKAFWVLVDHTVNTRTEANRKNRIALGAWLLIPKWERDGG